MLQFILKQKGYESEQWNMITNKRAHSALRVTLKDGRHALLDPMYGLVGYNAETKKLRSPEEIKALLKGNKDFGELFLLFDDKSDISFYKGFRDVRMGAQGEVLSLSATLPKIGNEPLYIGSLDQDHNDVYREGSKNKITPFWHYAGHFYDRSWVRSLTATQNIKLEITLIENVEDRIITAEPRPKIDGKKMIWEMDAGDTITFYDGRARLSWKRLNSYISVDQIALYPM